MNDNDNITIIIDSQKFETSRSLLSKYSEYFENIFSECKDLENENELVIENQDPQLFEHILKYFADITYKIPEEYSEEYSESCKFYLLKERCYETAELYREITKKIENIEIKLREECIKKIKTYEYIYFVNLFKHVDGLCLYIDDTLENCSYNDRLFLNINNARKFCENNNIIYEDYITKILTKDIICSHNTRDVINHSVSYYLMIDISLNKLLQFLDIETVDYEPAYRS